MRQTVRSRSDRVSPRHQVAMYSADGGAAGMLATVFAEPQTLVRQRETDPVTGLTTSIRGHLFQDVG